MYRKQGVSDSQHGFILGRSCLTDLVAFYSGHQWTREELHVTYLDIVQPSIWSLPTFLPLNQTDRGLMHGLVDGQGIGCVNAGMFKRKSATSGICIPQECILGPTLFSVFINDTDSGSDITLGKSARDTKGAMQWIHWREGMPSTGTLTGVKGGPVGIS
ncbi:hypothetical protein HGM15179_004128 [Zosterops borbonicus]|uniref:Uncharacterized protein n=1 Tax=Zosterops borbonicus TaxID=364589 RepID=A0A8K1GPT3_9PASS|nr:hypothetical protein HGM15179_004128 [Zosterops borbonicus]